MTAQTIAAKGITLAGQVVLAWLLTRSDFGLIGMAYTVMGFATVIQQGGLRQVLVQRQTHFDRWANPAFWLGLTLSVGAGLLMVATASLVARAYAEPGVTGLVMVLALSMPLDGLGIVPTAKLQTQLRFRLLALVAWVSGVGQMVLTILLAWMHLGAYSFAIARVVSVGLATAIVWWAARGVRVRRQPQMKRWRFLITDSSVLFAAAFITCAIHQGGSILLGLLQSKEAVGLYLFAYNLSLQSIQLISLNLDGVLFPTLSKLKDDVKRQTQAFVRATSALAAIAVPLCFLQAAGAEPVLKLFFDPKWYDAIPIIQLLSIGMAITASCVSASSVILAQGRFKTYLAQCVVAGLLFFAIVGYGAWAGEATGTAAGAAVYYFVTSVIVFCLAVRPAGGGIMDMVKTIGPSMLASTLSIGPAWALSQLLPDTKLGLFLQGAVTGCVGVALYLPLARVLMPATWAELFNRLGPLVRRVTGRFAPRTSV